MISVFIWDTRSVVQRCPIKSIVKRPNGGPTDFRKCPNRRRVVFGGTQHTEKWSKQQRSCITKACCFVAKHTRHIRTRAGFGDRTKTARHRLPFPNNQSSLMHVLSENIVTRSRSKWQRTRLRESWRISHCVASQRADVFLNATWLAVYFGPWIFENYRSLARTEVEFHRGASFATYDYARGRSEYLLRKFDDFWGYLYICIFRGFFEGNYS